jgi:hypothetical protein
VTTQGLSRIAGGIAIVAVLAVSGMVAWSILQQQDPDLGVQPAETPRSGEPIRLGDLSGYLGQIDTAAGTMIVAANPTGADPVMLTVASDAPVTVNGKPAGLADLSKDMPVTVFYEVRNEVKHVTSIQVVAERAPLASAPATTPAEAKPDTESRPPAEVRPPVEVKPAVSKPIPPPPATQAQVPAESKPPTQSRPPAEVKPVAPPPARPPAAPAPVPAPAATAVAPRPATVPPAAAPSAGQPATPRDDDGSAAVDWLLKGPGRR